MSGVSIVALVIWLIAATIGLRLLTLWSRQRKVNPLLYAYACLLVAGPGLWLVYTITGTEIAAFGWTSALCAVATLVLGELLFLRWTAGSGGERVTGSVPPAMIYAHGALTVSTAALTISTVLIA